MLAYGHYGVFDVGKFQHKCGRNAVVVGDDVPTQQLAVGYQFVRRGVVVVVTHTSSMSVCGVGMRCRRCNEILNTYAIFAYILTVKLYFLDKFLQKKRSVQ